MAKKSGDVFEKSMDELTHLVKLLEKGELSLEQALAQFERGVQLSQHCQKLLTQAEQKIEILTHENTLKDYNTHD